MKLIREVLVGMGITAINDIQVVMRSGRNVNITYDVNTIYTTNYKDEIQGLIYG